MTKREYRNNYITIIIPTWLPRLYNQTVGHANKSQSLSVLEFNGQFRVELLYVRSLKM